MTTDEQTRWLGGLAVTLGLAVLGFVALEVRAARADLTDLRGALVESARHMDAIADCIGDERAARRAVWARAFAPSIDDAEDPVRTLYRALASAVGADTHVPESCERARARR